MAKKILWWALISSVAIFAGCAMQPSGQRFMIQTVPLNCDGTGRCVIKVGVDKCAAVPNACDLHVDYSLVHFPPNAHGPIRWEVQEGFSFPNDGIVFDDGAQVFKNCHPVESGQAFQCENTHSQTGFHAYKYTIKIDGFAKTYPLDPWVVND